MTSPVRAPRPTPRRVAAPVVERGRRDHLRVVPPPSARPARRRHTGAIVVVAMGLLFASLLASAIFHGLLASGQTHLDQLDAELQEERTALAQEQMELAHLRSPERIAAEAAAAGMVPADTQHWVSAGTGDESIVVRDTTEPTDTTDTTDTTEVPGAAEDPATSELADGAGGGTPQ